MNEWMIEAHGLTKYFDHFLAVDHLSLQVKGGDILALLGPNGAGKTTTLRMLTSILRPSEGSASVAGFDVVAQPARVRASVGVLTEQQGLYGRMNADEYLAFFGSLYGLDPEFCQERMIELLAQFGLTSVRKKRVGEYSKGMRQKLALIRTILHDPPVIMLDEPTSAMDPESAFIVRDAIKTLKDRKRTLILCTHNLPEAEELADQIAIIKSGKIILNGSMQTVRKKMVGAQEFKAVFSCPVPNILLANIPGCHFIASGENWIQFATEDPAAVNPLVIRDLVSKGYPLNTVEEVQRSLEDIYLKTVSQEEPA